MIALVLLADAELEFACRIADDVELGLADDDAGRRDQAAHQRLEVEAERQFRDGGAQRAITAVDADAACHDLKIGAPAADRQHRIPDMDAIRPVRCRQRVFDDRRQDSDRERPVRHAQREQPARHDRHGQQKRRQLDGDDGERAERARRPEAAGPPPLTPPDMARSLRRAGRRGFGWIALRCYLCSPIDLTLNPYPRRATANRPRAGWNAGLRSIITPNSPPLRVL